MVSLRNLASIIAGLLVVGGGSLVSASPASAPALLPRQDCTGVGPSPGGPPCGGTDIMTCTTTETWQCPNGDSGPVPPGTQCICNAFRQPNWVPNNGVPPGDCTSGIVCVSGGTQFRVCGVSGLEPPQDVAPGTQCVNGGITFA